MNPEDIRAWCHIEYAANFTEDEIELFIGECLAMNIDPRMRPRVVTLRRLPTGRVYAHRHTDFMQHTAEEILRQRGQSGVFGSALVLEYGVSNADSKLNEFGLTEQGDLYCEITFIVNESRAYYDAFDARYQHEIAGLEKITFAERLEIRKQITEEMGEPPKPRTVVGIGLLPASAPHETAAGRARITRVERVTRLAKRDAIDQVFPAIFNVK